MSTERIYKGRSMGGTFRFGDRLKVEPAELSDIRAGEVVVYRSTGPGGTIREVVHRVARVLEDGLETRGDRNPFPDPVPVSRETLVGRVTGFERCGVWSGVPAGEPARRGRGVRRLARRVLPRKLLALIRNLYTPRPESGLAGLPARPAVRRGWFMTARGPAVKHIPGNRTAGTRRVRGRVFPSCFLVILLLLHYPALPAAGSEGRSAKASVDGIVKVPVANLRERPSTDSPVTARLKRGDRVTLLGRSGLWFAVRQPDDRLAWGHEMIFQKMKEGFSPETDGRSGEIRVPIGMVREKPSTGSIPLSRLRAGTRVSLIAAAGEWHAIELPDRSLGWAHRTILRESKPARSEPSSEATAWNELREIRFEAVGQFEEKILFSISRKEPPNISSLRGRIPMVVCEFLGTRVGGEMWESIRIDGTIVRRIRVVQREGLLPNVQVVLDLIPLPGSDFQVQPIFFDKQGVFVLVLRRIERQ